MRIGDRTRSSALVLAGLVVVACGGQPQPQPQDDLGTAPGAAAAKRAPVKQEAKVPFKQAAGAYTAGRYQQAEQQLEQAISRDPKFVEAYFNLGVLAEQRGDQAKAAEWYNKALQVNGSFGDALVNLGHMELARGNKGGAMSYFQKAIQVDPLNTEANLNMAVFARQQKNFPLAVKHIRAALQEDSQNPVAYQVLARTYYDLGKYDLTKLVCLNAFEMKGVGKRAAPLYNILGLVELKKKDVTTALAAFRQAVKADPEYVPALINVGAITFNYRDYEQAYKAFESALRVQPKNVEALLSKAVAARGLERFDEAEKGYKAVLALNPNHPGAHFNLGVLFQMYKNNMQGALKEFEAVLRLEGRDQKIRKEATQRIKAIRIQMQAMQEAEAMMKEEKAREEAEKRAAAQKAKQDAAKKKKAPKKPPAKKP